MEVGSFLACPSWFQEALGHPCLEEGGLRVRMGWFLPSLGGQEACGEDPLREALSLEEDVVACGDFEKGRGA